MQRSMEHEAGRSAKFVLHQLSLLSFLSVHSLLSPSLFSRNNYYTFSCEDFFSSANILTRCGLPSNSQKVEWPSVLVSVARVCT